MADNLTWDYAADTDFAGIFFCAEGKKRNKLLQLRINMMECDYKEVLQVYEEKEIL